MSHYQRARELMAQPVDDTPQVRRPSAWPAIGWLSFALAAALWLAWLTAWPIFFI